MTLLKEVREFHENDSNFEQITINGNLFDVSVHAKIEKKYKAYLQTQMEYFPYMLKSQWRFFYGKARSWGHQAIKDLVEMKVLGEGAFQGNDYLYPLTRAVKWYTGNSKARPFNSLKKRQSNVTLLDNFMRAEYFLHKGKPISTSPSSFFQKQIWDRLENKGYIAKKKELKVLNEKIEKTKEELEELEKKLDSYESMQNTTNKAIRNMLEEAQLCGELLVRLEEVLEPKYLEIKREIEQIEATLPPFQLTPLNAGAIRKLGLSEEWKNRKVFNNEISLDTMVDQYKFLENCLCILPERHTFFEDIQFFREQIELKLVIIHFRDTRKEKYERLFEILDHILNCFTKTTLKITVLVENEDLARSSAELFKKLIEEKSSKYISKNNVVVYNTNIDRYFFEGDSDKFIEQVDFSNLEYLVADIQEFLKEKSM